MTAKWGEYNESFRTMFPQGLYEESSTKKLPLGTMRPLEDGRVYVYAKAGAVDLSPALACAFITTKTEEQTVANAASAGDKTVYVTAAGITANLWVDGWLVVAAGTGIGEYYKIRANKATDSDGVVEVQLYDAIATAWSTTDTDLAVYPSKYNGVVVNPVDAQQRPVLIPVRSVTAAYYFWGLVRGVGPLKMDVNAAAGLELDEKIILASTNHAGQGMLTTTPSNADMRHHIGYVIDEEDLTDNDVALVDVDLI